MNFTHISAAVYTSYNASTFFGDNVVSSCFWVIVLWKLKMSGVSIFSTYLEYEHYLKIVFHSGHYHESRHFVN